jgi:threonyl-tRNA synthetase
MAKKDKKGGKKAVATITLNETAKFSTIDAPGVSQPAVEEASAASSSAGGLQGRRAKASTGPRMEGDKASIGGDSFTERTKNPPFLQDRNTVYEDIKARRAAELGTKNMTVAITVTMPDGKVMDKDREGTPFFAWKTSPFHVAQVISQGLADSSAVARVTYESFVDDYSPAEDGMEGEDTLMDAMEDGGIETSESASAKTMLWDMTRPLVGPVSKLEFLKFDSDKEAKTVFWHSSAHMMGEALEHLYGCKLTIGPPLAGGFYYDSYMGSDAFREEDCEYILLLLLRFSLSLSHTFANPLPLPCFTQTPPSKPKSTKSSRPNKNLNAWSLPRKRVWNSLPTILSRSKS